MAKKTRKKFTEEEKRQAVADYVSGARTAQTIANELGTDIQAIYRWRTFYDEQRKDLRLSELQAEGSSQELAERIIRLQDEVEAYQKKVAEQAIMLDLLKKLRTSGRFQPESELSGLIATTKKSDLKKKRVK